MFFAFNKEQFDENKTYKNASDDEYLPIGGGVYIHKSDKGKLTNFYNSIVPKLKKDFLNKIKMEDLIEYELVNHESYYTNNYTEVSFLINDYYEDLTLKEVSAKVKEVYERTKDKHLSMYEYSIDNNINI